jgi:glutathione peroxidase
MRGLMRKVYGGVTTHQGEGASLYSLTSAVPNTLSSHKGEVVLIVNTASQCGFTKQYDALEELYQRYKDRGFVVLGFPSNDFMNQEPQGDAEIQATCRINHGVSFPLLPKAPVRRGDKQPVFKFLTEQGPSDLRGAVLWNFEKFLVDREGHLIGRWRSYVTPESSSIRRAIEKAVGA